MRYPMGFLALAALAAVTACSTASTPRPPSIVAASPPKDDGKPAQGGSGGIEHAAALEELKVGIIAMRPDRQNSINVPLPDAEHWTRVKFWGIPTLVGFRYGQGHHAVVAGYVTHVDDNQAPGACGKSFEKWAMPLIEAYDIEIHHEPATAFSWHRKPETTDFVDVESLYAKGATLLEQSAHAVAYAAYPAWKGACLVLGVGVPSRDGDEARAEEVRDRFARDVLPKVEILSDTEPTERY